MFPFCLIFPDVQFFGNFCYNVHLFFLSWSDLSFPIIHDVVKYLQERPDKSRAFGGYFFMQYSNYQSGPMYQPPVPNKRSAGMETAAFVLGIVSIVTCTCIYISVVCGALAIMFDSWSDRSDRNRHYVCLSFCLCNPHLWQH